MRRRRKKCSHQYQNCRTKHVHFAMAVGLIVGRLGLGAPLPADVKDGDARRQELTSNDKLRRQLLGKDFQRIQGKGLNGNRSTPASGLAGSKPLPPPTKRELKSDDEEEAGRSSLGKSKRKRVVSRREAADGEDDGDVKATFGGAAETPDNPRPPKKASNYLDEVLAERSRKKQKKKNKKRRKGRAEGGNAVQ